MPAPGTLVTGFIGTGAIVEALVTGLCAHAGHAGPVLVSRRSAARSARLAGRFTNVAVLDDNQDLAARSRLVFIGVLPEQAPEVLGTLRFHEDQCVVSLVAGLDLASLSTLVAPASPVYRAVPMPPVAHGAGPLPLCPAPEPWLRELLRDTGEIIGLDDESQFQALAACTALMAAYFELLAGTARWLRGAGLDPAPAAAFTTSMFGALTGVAAGVPPGSLPRLSEDCLTAGGLNEQVLRDLRAAGWFGEWAKALDRVQDRLAAARRPHSGA